MTSPHPSEDDIDRERRRAGRIAAVRATGLLDRPANAHFDRLTRVAATVLDVPVAFLSVIDADRDFYLSQHGFGEPLSKTREQQGRTFCHYGLMGDGALVIEDTMSDKVFAAVPTVSSMGIRAYAGVPLLSADGQMIGSFCAVDFKPRQWSGEQIKLLSDLATLAMREIVQNSVMGANRELAKAAEAALAERQDVLAVMVHDARNPMMLISMASRLVGNDKPEVRERAQKMLVTGVQQLKEMLDELADASLFEKGNLKLRVEPTDVSSLVHAVEMMMQPTAQRREIRILTDIRDGGCFVHVDSGRMMRVFANLVGNALKFSERGTVVTVGARCLPGWAEFSVADQGPGIAPEYLDSVFGRFWQGKSDDRRGSGLGLAITKAIVEAHGGQVAVESVVGEGSTFRVLIPLDAQA